MTVGLPRWRPFDEHPGQRRDRGRDLRDGHRHAGLQARGHRRAGVEAEPADPQEARADEGQDHVMARARLLALAEQEAGHESGDARVDMDDGSAGEVEDLEPALEVAFGVDVGRAHEAVRTPDPMGDRRVDEDRPQADEPQHRRELHALGERARDERRRDDRERHLEHHVDGLRDRRRQRIGRVRAARQVIMDALEKDAREAAYECAAAGEREAVGEDEVDHRDQRRDGEARHHRIADVLLADHAAVEEPEARDGHHQNERDRGQNPGRVAGIDRALFE